MKGKILKIQEAFIQIPLPTLYPPAGAEVLCIEEHRDSETGELWFIDVLYQDKIYAVDQNMVDENVIEGLEPGMFVVLQNGMKAMIISRYESNELGTFFTVLIDGLAKEVPALEIKEIIESCEN